MISQVFTGRKRNNAIGGDIGSGELSLPGSEEFSKSQGRNSRKSSSSDTLSAPRSLKSSITAEFSQLVKRELEVTARQEESRVLSGTEFTLNKLNLTEVGVVGRETEKHILVEAFLASLKHQGPNERNCRSSICLTGLSGSGKTSLALQLRPHVLGHKGFFSVGKFDMQNSANPCSAFTDAFSGLVEQILARDEETIREICASIQELLGDQFDVLSNVVPSLEKLLPNQKQSTTNDKAGQGRSGQLQYAVEKFIQAISTDRHPLVLVLDDMQRADQGSLQLIEGLMTDSNLSSFLLVTTARGNELHDDHPFVQKLCLLEELGVNVRRIEVGDLSEEAVNAVTATALRSEPQATKPLATLVHKKTRGNAFFVLQFLQSLKDKNLLTFNFGTLSWSWDIMKIQALAATDNVADLMKDKLQQLDNETQFAIHCAAFLGQHFELATLEKVVASICNADVKATNELSDIIDRCINHGLLEGDGSTISFVHDQVQAAALNLDSQHLSTVSPMHIGQQLLADEGGSGLGDNLFLAVDLCNTAMQLLETKERQKLAQHNLNAGNRAMEKAAFPKALRYFEAGLLCLGNGYWSNHSNFALDLCCGAAEAAFCSGDDDRLEELLTEVLSRDLPLKDKMRAYLVRIRSYSAKERFKDAVETGILLLKKLGMFKQISTSVSIVRVLVSLTRTQRLLRNHNQETLSALPILQDEKRIVAMCIVDLLAASTYLTNKNLFLLLWIKTVQWCVKYGVCQYSTTAFGAYGMTVGVALGDWKLAFSHAEVALALSERLANSKETFAKTVLAAYAYTNIWTHDMRTSIKPLLYGYQKGMQAGDIEYAGYCLLEHDRAIFLSGALTLDVLIRNMEEHSLIFKRHHHKAAYTYWLILLQTCRNLKGDSDHPTSLSSKELDEDAIRELGGTGQMVQLDRMIKMVKMQLNFYFGHHHQAGCYADESADVGTEYFAAHELVPRHFFFRGLTYLALARKGERKGRNLRIGKQTENSLRKLAKQGSVDCLHMAQLLQAEITGIKGKHEEAIELYKAAIKSASRGGFVHDRALAHELAGGFHLEHGDNDYYWATYHLENAIQCYRDWGAYAKVQHVMDKHGTIIMGV